MQDVRAALAETIDQAAWEWLSPHADRDALIIVTADLDILDVGLAIATNNVSQVQRWIEEQHIYKPSPEQLITWDANESKSFQALIVQPYVLAQEA
jgi:hypothetical protein